MGFLITFYVIDWAGSLTLINNGFLSGATRPIRRIGAAGKVRKYFEFCPDRIDFSKWYHQHRQLFSVRWAGHSGVFYDGSNNAL